MCITFLKCPESWANFHETALRCSSEVVCSEDVKANVGHGLKVMKCQGHEMLQFYKQIVTNVVALEMRMYVWGSMLGPLKMIISVDQI